MEELQKLIEELEKKATSCFYGVEKAEINIWYVIGRLQKIMMHGGVKLTPVELEETGVLTKELEMYKNKYQEALRQVADLQGKILKKGGDV